MLEIAAADQGLEQGNAAQSAEAYVWLDGRLPATLFEQPQIPVGGITVTIRTEEPDAPPPAYFLRFAEKTFFMTMNESRQLIVESDLPEGASYRFTVSDDGILSVDEGGTIFPKMEGTADVTVSDSTGSYHDTCTVQITGTAAAQQFSPFLFTEEGEALKLAGIYDLSALSGDIEIPPEVSVVNLIPQGDGMAAETDEFSGVKRTVTGIGPQVFRELGSVNSVTIPWTVEFIDDAAFENCPLTDIYIGKPENGISGAPWGAANATVHWQG